MTHKWLVLGVAAAGLLTASSMFDPADARHGGGGGGGGGGGRSGGWSGGGGGSSYHGSGNMGGRSSGNFMARSPSGSSRPNGYAYRSHNGNRVAHGRHHRNRFFAGGYDYYAYSDGCYWLRQRAISSGSSYWWNRYYACADGYGYY
jgi:hypothetical protein